MTHIDDVEVESYIYSLEKKIYSIEKSHSYRIGQSIVGFYSRKYGVVEFIQRILSSTKKIESKKPERKKVVRRLGEHDIQAVDIPLIEKKHVTNFSGRYKFGPLSCNELVFGILTKKTRRLIKKGSVFISAHPLTIQDHLENSSVDRFVIDLNALSNCSAWFGLGIPGETNRNVDFERLLRVLNKKGVEVEVFNSQLFSKYPVLAKLLSFPKQ